MTTKARKRLVLLFAVLVFLGGYVGSFFAVRKTIVSRDLTVIDLSQEIPAPTPERIEIRLHYFSMHPGVHRALYTVYYPIHSFLGGDMALLADGGAALRASPKLAATHSDYYVHTPDQLRFAEARPGESPAPR
jgi:hypothetical protein